MHIGNPGLMRKVPALVGVLLTLAVLGFIVYRLDLAALGRALAGARYRYVAHLLVTTVALHAIAAVQWRFLLSPIKWVGPVRLFGAQMIGALAHGLIQMPVSAVVKAYVVARREQVSMSAVLATTLTDRLVDGIAFLVLLGVVLAATELPPGTVQVQPVLRAAGWTTLGLYVGLTTALVCLRSFPAQGTAFVERLVGLVAPLRAGRVAGLYARFCQGIGLPVRWRARALLVACALGKKAIVPFQVYWIARAFGLELPWTAYLFQVVFLGFLLFVASAVGIRGTYQAGLVVALGFYGASKEVALAIALVVEVVAHGAAMGLGLFFLWVEGITREELRAMAGAGRQPAEGSP